MNNSTPTAGVLEMVATIVNDIANRIRQHEGPTSPALVQFYDAVGDAKSASRIVEATQPWSHRYPPVRC